MLFYQKHTIAKRILKYQLVTANPHFTDNTIHCMHQTLEAGLREEAYHPAVSGVARLKEVGGVSKPTLPTA